MHSLPAFVKYPHAPTLPATQSQGAPTPSAIPTPLAFASRPHAIPIINVDAEPTKTLLVPLSEPTRASVEGFWDVYRDSMSKNVIAYAANEPQFQL